METRGFWFPEVGGNDSTVCFGVLNDDFFVLTWDADLDQTCCPYFYNLAGFIFNKEFREWENIFHEDQNASGFREPRKLLNRHREIVKSGPKWLIEHAQRPK